MIFARLIGYFFNRYKQPVVIGEIFAGVILGGFLLGHIGGQSFSLLGFAFQTPPLDFTGPDFTMFANIGILFLLFLSGLEMKVSTFKKVEKTSCLVAILGIVVPLVLGCLVGLCFSFSLQVSLIIGVILVATSVGVTVRVLMDLHMLDSDVGATILGSAVIDDVIGVVLLAFVLGTGSPLLFGLKVVAFILVFLFIGLKTMGKIMRIGEKVHLPNALLSLSIAMLMLLAFFAEQVEIASITGAFIAGLLISNTVQSKKILKDIRTIGYGLFIPLFFVWVGASIDLSAFMVIGPLAAIVVLVGILGKIMGCGLGAKLSRMNTKESLQVGIGMVPRMEVALIVVTTAIAQGILTGWVAQQLLAITILLTIITTLITPFLIKLTFKKQV